MVLLILLLLCLIFWGVIIIFAFQTAWIAKLVLVIVAFITLFAIAIVTFFIVKAGEDKYRKKKRDRNNFKKN